MVMVVHELSQYRKYEEMKVAMSDLLLLYSGKLRE